MAVAACLAAAGLVVVAAGLAVVVSGLASGSEALAETATIAAQETNVDSMNLSLGVKNVEQVRYTFVAQRQVAGTEIFALFIQIGWHV